MPIFRSRPNLSRLFIAAALGMFQLFWHSSAVAKSDLVFGIVPQQSASRLAQIWGPVFNHLSERTGQKIRFGTAKDIPTFEACLAKGAYDLAYMNPYHYTTFNRVSGYQAFARQAKKRLRGLIVVRKDSGYQDLGDLDNQSIAFPSPAAFGASVIPRAEMKNRDMAIRPAYVKSHDSVYRAVVAGLFPAGGGVLRTFGNFPEDLKSQLRVLYRTEAYTPHAFAAHPDLDKAIVAAITEQMLMMGDQQPELLKALGMKGFEQARNADWNDVRSLNLKKSHTDIVLDNRLTCHSG